MRPRIRFGRPDDEARKKMTKKPSYVVVTPARDEAKYIPLTIASLAAQSIRPLRWVIVNDGSTDETGRIADEAARSHAWITVVNRVDRGFRKAGGGVVDAFYEGYRCVEDDAWDYLIKLDGDLSFAPDYFEKCFEHFDENPRLGIAGGTICSETEVFLRWNPSAIPSFTFAEPQRFIGANVGRKSAVCSSARLGHYG